MNPSVDALTDITSNRLPWRPYRTKDQQHAPQQDAVFNFFDDDRQGCIWYLHARMV